MVAIPPFLNQEAEAYDASATQLTDFAQIAMETVATDDGTDTGAAPALPDPALAAAAGDLPEPADAPADELVAVTVRLTAAAEQALQDLAIRRGVSTTQVLGEAIVEKKFFSDQRRDGTEVVLRFPDGSLSTVQWVAAQWPLGDLARGARLTRICSVRLRTRIGPFDPPAVRFGPQPVTPGVRRRPQAVKR